MPAAGAAFSSASWPGRLAQALLRLAQALPGGYTASAQGKAATGGPNWSWGKRNLMSDYWGNWDSSFTIL